MHFILSRTVFISCIILRTRILFGAIQTDEERDTLDGAHVCISDVVLFYSHM
jgi:hypothetical protein